MANYVLLLLATMAVSAFGSRFVCTRPPFYFVRKVEWGGRPATAVTKLNTPVRFVIIHHTLHPGACFTRASCNAAMISMQNYHQLTLGYDDIEYNFAVGGDFSVYEGRGWDVVGGHSLGYNMFSLNIAVIGDYSWELPSQRQLQVVKDLITVGIQIGFISEDYTLLGHRQVQNTLCPGDALFAEISTWERFASAIPVVSNSRLASSDIL